MGLAHSEQSATMSKHLLPRSHADSIRRDLMDACARLNEHQQRLDDLLQAMGCQDQDSENATDHEESEYP